MDHVVPIWFRVDMTQVGAQQKGANPSTRSARSGQAVGHPATLLLIADCCCAPVYLSQRNRELFVVGVGVVLQDAEGHCLAELD